MERVVKVGALLVVSTGIIYTAYILYDNYKKKEKKQEDIKPLFSSGTMGNVTCIQPPCF